MSQSVPSRGPSCPPGYHSASCPEPLLERQGLTQGQATDS